MSLPAQLLPPPPTLSQDECGLGYPICPNRHVESAALCQWCRNRLPYNLHKEIEKEAADDAGLHGKVKQWEDEVRRDKERLSADIDPRTNVPRSYMCAKKDPDYWNDSWRAPTLVNDARSCFYVKIKGQLCHNCLDDARTTEKDWLKRDFDERGVLIPRDALALPACVFQDLRYMNAPWKTYKPPAGSVKCIRPRVPHQMCGPCFGWVSDTYPLKQSFSGPWAKFDPKTGMLNGGLRASDKDHQVA